MVVIGLQLYGFVTMLAAVFIGLKLASAGVAGEWSWWFTLSPVWVPVVVAVAIGVVVGAIHAVVKTWRYR